MSQTKDRSRSERKDAYETVLGIIENNTGGKQPAMLSRSALYTTATTSSGMDRANVKTALGAAIENGAVAQWHGRFFRVEEESIVAVIEAERESEYPRGALIGKCNRLLKQCRGGNQ